MSKKKISKTRSKPQKKKGNFIDFFSDKRVKLSIGIFITLFSIILFLAFFSFLFTWKIDQSFTWENLFDSKDMQAENWSAKIGAVLANQFMNSWFGLASFSFPFVLFLYGLKLCGITLLPVSRTLRHSIFLTIWTSVMLSFLFGYANGYLGSGPGGSHGIFMSMWLSNLIGKLGSAFLLIFLMFLYLTFSFKSFLPFINKLFKNKVNLNSLPFLSFGKDRIRKESESTLNNNEKTSEQNKDDELPINDADFTIELNDSEVISYDENQELKDKKDAMNQVTGLEIPDLEPIQEEKTGLDENKNNFEVEVAEGDPNRNNKDSDPLQNLGEYQPELDLSDYQFPPISLMEDHKGEKSEVSKEELVRNKDKIVETLSHYKIKIEKIKATIGPTITLYEIVPAPGIRISKIKNLEDDIAMSLAALGIRIIAPIPGKGTIGIEVPNQKPEIVSMRSLLISSRFAETKYELPVAIGKTISNETFVFDLTKMPHLLVAGATGQGKSVGLNVILTSLLYKKHPAELKFVLVDPKKVELTLYAQIEKHYLAKLPDSEEPIITDTQKVVYTLNSLTIEMDQRYNLLKKAQVRNIKEYNKKFKERRLNPEKGHRFLPYIVLVVDELADLIMTAGKEIEVPIARIAQLARAVGIHLIIATQRPSTNIITGTIKANFPARMAFRVTSMIDSRTILDSPGANQVIGRGDMLLSAGSDIVRIQCAFVDTPEIENLCTFIAGQRGYPTAHLLPEYVDESAGEGPQVDLSKRDELFEEAARLIVLHQQGSTSLIQRKFSIGYNRAGRIIDQLEAAGIVGPYEGSKARQVLYPDEYSLEQYLKSF